MDIIVLSILSALTSGPIVIQRQVRSLCRPASFGRFTNLSGSKARLVLSWVIPTTMGVMFVPHAIYTSPHRPHIAKHPLGELVVVNIVFLYLSFLLFLFGMSCFWLFRLTLYFCQSSVDFLLRFLGVSGELPPFNSNV